MTQYARGAIFERKVQKELESRNFTTFRSAGSHSPADIIALRQGEVVLIQCQLSFPFAKGKVEALEYIARENKCQAWLAWNERGLVVYQVVV